MKRIIAILFVALCLVSSGIAEPWRVFDNAGLFSAEEIQDIEQAIFDFQRKTNFDFAVLTTDDYIGNQNQCAIADSFYDAENFGFGHQASGMLYYIDMNQRIPYISTCGEMIVIFNETTLTDTHEAAFPLLASAQYKDAVLTTIESASKAVTAYKNDAE